MKLIKEHIVFRLLTIVLVLTLLIPAAVKFAHVFEHHNHKVCLGEDRTHIHEVDLDCEFQKFSITHHFQLPVEFIEFFQTLSPTRTYNLTYKFLNNHRPLSFSLRGPPALV
ncbi:hypothetical protein FPF71_15790 [Algibacter amylolyticus]|uniref:Uncharacterized protein n=1 Tax=Algibacter amylolyticus TaxID=1608400 RepID=A0A5M7AX13_9FLAO|nr:hypothetical protein [Algibacter amylolyticus]KAA5821966.1 hypothetical protein F2B50_15790 [Algibacter amylolyticus]MBB5269232.1 hypothetical protein [Algibacter amylolyticus]TSJ73250.1 hypothetical protein FPF71_15790 [Algibacter amylolyticus]